MILAPASLELGGGNAKQLARLGKAATTPAILPDMNWISFRLCDEIDWSDSKARDVLD